MSDKTIVSFDIKTLVSALKACARVASGKHIPVLGMARLKGTTLSATNLDCHVHVVVGEYAGVDMLIPVKPMLELLKGQGKASQVELAGADCDCVIMPIRFAKVDG